MGVYSDNCKTALRLAMQLRAADESALALELLRKTVKQEARLGERDMLTAYYGNDVYSGLTDAEAAVRYVFVAKVLIEFNTAIETVGGISTAGGWATSNANKNFDGAKIDAMCDFFRWLYSVRTPVEADHLRFKRFLDLLAGTPSFYPASSQVRNMKLTGVLTGLAGRRITISDNGELKCDTE